MLSIVADARLVSACGLYCGACGRYLRGRCPGCRENARASWCGVRRCNQARGQASCAECQEVADPRACRRYHTRLSRIVGLLLRSDRAAGIARIRAVGAEAFAAERAAARRPSLPR